ncbi:aldose 1-epimerase [Thorsellia kenyensis]|uniref:Aldose 1-epimerase n=1 Tax=Thorsellia kenyensis TaxID=1549888 RepID=A0ABV6CD36_9GAMM
MTKSNNDIISLKNKDSELRLLPKLGGAILSFEYLGQQVFREVDEETFFKDPTVRLTACYPLVPFSNRIANGKFKWEDEEYTLRKNFGDSPHALHGLGWQSEWNISEVKEDEATLTLSHKPKSEGDWPFAFKVDQQFKLINNELHLSLTVENQDAKTMPCGLGWHPFFKRSAQTHCEFIAKNLWQNDDNMLPSQSIEIDSSLLKELFQPLGETPKLDNCLSGFEGYFSLKQPEFNRQIDIYASKALNHLVIFTPPTGTFIAIEPVTHRNAAINTNDPKSHGIETLAPNCSMNVTCIIKIDSLESSKLAANN